MLNINAGPSTGSIASCIWKINQDREPGHKIPLIGNKFYCEYAISEFN
jgi:hypothetical protein